MLEGRTCPPKLSQLHIALNGRGIVSYPLDKCYRNAIASLVIRHCVCVCVEAPLMTACAREEELCAGMRVIERRDAEMSVGMKV